MAQRLAGYLHQTHPGSAVVQEFPTGTLRDDLPGWVIVDDGAFIDDGADELVFTTRDDDPPAGDGEDEPEDDSDDESPVAAPSRSGPGSSREAWVAYAEALGLAVEDDDTRDAIIDVVDSHLATKD